jgi:hypothetical protein
MMALPPPSAAGQRRANQPADILGVVPAQHDVVATAPAAAAWHGRAAPRARRPAPSRRRSPMARCVASCPRCVDRAAVVDAAALARQRREELALAVAGDAGDGDDLAGRARVRSMSRSGMPWITSGQARVSPCTSSKAGAAVPAAPAGALRSTTLAHHQRGQRARRLDARIGGAHHLAAAQDGRRRADAAHLLQLVRDEQDARAAVRSFSSEANRFSLPAGSAPRSARRDQQLGILQQAARTISMRCRSPAERVQTGRCGSSFSP